MEINIQNEIFFRKYMKYKNKYVYLKNKAEQEGGTLLLPGKRYIFYCSYDENVKNKLSKYIEGDNFPNFNEFSKIFGNNQFIFSLRNGGTLVLQSYFEFYRPLITYNILDTAINILITKEEKDVEIIINLILFNTTPQYNFINIINNINNNIYNFCGDALKIKTKDTSGNFIDKIYKIDSVLEIMVNLTKPNTFIRTHTYTDQELKVFTIFLQQNETIFYKYQNNETLKIYKPHTTEIQKELDDFISSKKIKPTTFNLLFDLLKEKCGGYNITFISCCILFILFESAVSFFVVSTASPIIGITAISTQLAAVVPIAYNHLKKKLEPKK